MTSLTEGRRPIEYGVTYWAADVGPYIWHEYDGERVAADLRALSQAGHRMVRTHLAWDAFMRTPGSVDTSRLRDLERFLSAAEAESLRVVPGLFVQSLGDCVMLPHFAIDVGNPRRGVRTVTDGVVQPGGPRDVYTEPLMLEAQLTWLERLLSAFGGHPAIAWWDLGHDPAATVRPRRVAHLRSWASLVTQPLRDLGYRSALTLGADDVLTARGVRPAAVADMVDVLGITIDPQLLPLRDGDLGLDPTLFVIQLSQRLSGIGSLHVHVGTCERDDEDALADCADPQITARYAADAVNALASAGCGGVFALQWSCAAARIRESAPFDRMPRLARRGFVDASGAPTRFGDSWSREIARERELQAASPWPPQLDVESFYSNLPESAQDLFVAWRGQAT